MDYFGIIKRLGLFSETPAKSQSACRLPPVSAKSIKMPPSTHMVVPKPLLYSPSGCVSSQARVTPAKMIEFRTPKPRVPKFKYLSQQSSPRYSASSSAPRGKPSFPRPSGKLSTPSLLKDEFSGICAWRDKSLGSNDL